MTANTYQNMLNNLPKDWETKKFSELGRVISGGTPSRDNPGYWHGDIPWLTPGEISSNAVKCLAETEENISNAGLNGSGANLLPENSLMITSRATLGARAINTVPMTTNQGFKNVAFYDSEDAGFYYYLLDLVKPEMIRRASGTTFLEISSKEFSDIDLPVPPKKERLVIEKTFDTHDTTIRQTEAIIAKLQQVKQGLLHDLLTRGIDDSGQLRPPQHLAPELYKESPLGWIPQDWNFGTLGNLLINIEGGWSPNCNEVRPPVGEWGVLKVSAVTSGFYRDEEAKILPPTLRPKTHLEVKPEDVILTRANGNPELVAKTVIVRETQEHLMLSDKLLRLKPIHSVLPEYLVYLMDFHKTRNQIGTLLSGSSGQKNISQYGIRSLIVPYIPYKEQLSGEELMKSCNAKIDTEKTKLAKVKKQKTGLMNDLLTGKVRVTSLL